MERPNMGQAKGQLQFKQWRAIESVCHFLRHSDLTLRIGMYFLKKKKNYELSWMFLVILLGFSNEVPKDDD